MMSHFYRYLAYLYNVCMFTLAAAFLGLFATLFQYLLTDHYLRHFPYQESLVVLVFSLPLFVLDRLGYEWLRGTAWSQQLIAIIGTVLFPPWRLLRRSTQSPSQVFWWFAWHSADAVLFHAIERRLLFISLFLTLCMAPIWFLWWTERPLFTESLVFFHLFNIGNSLIWGLYIAEMLILLRLSNKPLSYLRIYWLDLPILISPMFAPLRLFKLLKLINIYAALEYYIARLMFILSVVFLSLSAVLIQYSQIIDPSNLLPYHDIIFIILLSIWPIFWLERGLAFIFCEKQTWRGGLFSLWIMILPPLHFATRRCHDHDYIWLFNNWRLVDIVLYERLEKKFLYVILILSALMLPLWLIELFIPTFIQKYIFLEHLFHLGNALVWGLFVAEFVIMFSMSKKKGDYLLKHWLELSIIILPMFALIRFLPFTFSIFSKAAKLQRVLKLYRARIILHRILRIMQIIQLIRFWHRLNQQSNPEQYLTKLEEKYQEKQQELDEIAVHIQQTKKIITERKQYCLFDKRPTQNARKNWFNGWLKHK